MKKTETIEDILRDIRTLLAPIALQAWGQLDIQLPSEDGMLVLEKLDKPMARVLKRIFDK